MNKVPVIALAMMLFCGVILAMDESFYGGPSRLQALGGQEIVVQDSASMLDLYESGFASAIFTRPPGSIIYLYPEIDLSISKSVQNNAAQTTHDDLGFSGGNALYKDRNNGLAFRLAPDMSLVVKPYFNLGMSSIKITKPGTPLVPEQDVITGEYDGSGDIELAKKLGDRISVAGVIGYYRDTGMSDSKAFNNKDTSYWDKVDYEVTAAILPENEGGWSFAVSAGDKAGVMPVYFSDSKDAFLYMMDRGVLGSFFSTHEYSITDDGLNRAELYTDQSMTGFDGALGAACGKAGDTQFSAKVRVLASVNDVHSSKLVLTDLTTNAVVTTIDPSYKDVKNGMGADTDFNFRKNMGGIELGAKFSLFSLAYKSEDPAGLAPDTDKMFLHYKLSTGFDAGDRGFNVPLEVFFEHAIQDSKSGADEDTSQYFDFGAKLGAELALQGLPVLRVGADYVMGGEKLVSKSGGVTISTVLPGTDASIWHDQVGINCGVGFRGDSSEVNIGARYVPYWTVPKRTNYTQYDASALKIMADIKFFI